MIISGRDDAYMASALAVAASGSGPDDIPVGALVAASDGTVIAASGNRREADQDPTAHCEVLALRAAARERESWRLDGCTLVVSLEPCPMCAGAAVNARISRIVYGAPNPDYGACGSVWDIPRERHVHHRAEVVAGVRAAEAQQQLDDFFALRRRR